MGDSSFGNVLGAAVTVGLVGTTAKAAVSLGNKKKRRKKKNAK